MNYSKKNIKEHFNIKIEKGKKFDLNEAKKILIKVNSNKKQIEEKKTYGIFVKPNSKFFYSIVCGNPFKRKFTPIDFYGYIPLRKERFGKAFEKDLSHSFYNYTVIKDKNEIIKGFKNTKKKTGKKFYLDNSDFVNVFELMFSVQGVENNIIVLQKNDVSKILENYSNDEENFMRYFYF